MDFVFLVWQYRTLLVTIRVFQGKMLLPYSEKRAKIRERCHLILNYQYVVFTETVRCTAIICIRHVAGTELSLPFPLVSESNLRAESPGQLENGFYPSFSGIKKRRP